MSLRERLMGTKRPVAPDGTALAGSENGVDAARPVAAGSAMRVQSNSASGMYSRKSEEVVLTPVDQLKVDLHRRLIERLDLEALEQIPDERRNVEPRGDDPQDEGDTEAHRQHEDQIGVLRHRIR